MKITSNFLTFVFLLFSIVAFNVEASAQDELQKLPSVDVKYLDGKTVDLASFGENGKITAISVWATWCGPCKKELSAITEIYEDWTDEFENFEFLAITIDDARQLTKVPGMVETKGWPFTILAADQTELLNALNFQNPPQTFLVDEAGNIVFSHNGYVPGDEFELEDKIKEIAKK